MSPCVYSFFLCSFLWPSPFLFSITFVVSFEWIYLNIIPVFKQCQKSISRRIGKPTRLVLQHTLILAVQLPEPPEKSENTTAVRTRAQTTFVLGYFTVEIGAAFQTRISRRVQRNQSNAVNSPLKNSCLIHDATVYKHRTAVSGQKTKFAVRFLSLLVVLGARLHYNQIYQPITDNFCDEQSLLDA